MSSSQQSTLKAKVVSNVVYAFSELRKVGNLAPDEIILSVAVGGFILQDFDDFGLDASELCLGLYNALPMTQHPASQAGAVITSITHATVVLQDIAQLKVQFASKQKASNLSQDEHALIQEFLTLVENRIRQLFIDLT